MWTSNVQLCFLKCLFGAVLWQFFLENRSPYVTNASVHCHIVPRSKPPQMDGVVCICMLFSVHCIAPKKVVFIPKKQFCLQKKKFVKCALMFWGKAVHKEIIVSQHIQLKPTGKKMQKNQNLSAKTGQHRNIPHPPKKKK